MHLVFYAFSFLYLCPRKKRKIELISGLPSCCVLSYSIKHLSMCSSVIASGFPTFIVLVSSFKPGSHVPWESPFCSEQFLLLFSIRRFLPHRLYFIRSLPSCLRRVVEIEMLFYSATALTSCQNVTSLWQFSLHILFRSLSCGRHLLPSHEFQALRMVIKLFNRGLVKY